MQKPVARVKNGPSQGMLPRLRRGALGFTLLELLVVVVVIRLCYRACLAHPLALEPLAKWPILIIVLHIGGDRLGSRCVCAIRKGPILLIV